MPTLDYFRSTLSKDLNCVDCQGKENQMSDSCLCRGFFSLLKKSIHFYNKDSRNLFLEILLRLNEDLLDISTFVYNMNDFKVLLENTNQLVLDFFKKTFTEEMRFQSIDW